MKKSKFYFSVSQACILTVMISSVIIVQYPLFLFFSTIIGLIGAQQLITYKKLWVVENRILESEAQMMIRKQKTLVRVIQITILITAILIASQTFHKIKF